MLERPKALALLTYIAIALPRGLHRRDELIAIFWPDSDPVHARNSLRQSIHQLRSLLPPEALHVRGSDEVELIGIEVDVVTFEDLLEHGREGEALSLYRGELLNGFRLSYDSEFDSWLEAERDRLRRRAVRGAIVQAKVGEIDGDREGSAEWAMFALDRAPFDDDLLREVIQIFVRLEKKSEAARIYADAVKRFETELGLALSIETVHVGAAISRSGPASPRIIGSEPKDTPPRSNVSQSETPSGLRKARVVTPEARQLFLQGRQFAAERSPVTIMKAIESYENAIRLSPDYAEAHSALSSAFCQAPVYVAYPGIDAWPRVRAHATRAIRLDPRLGEAHATLAHATLCYDYDWTLAERLYREALILDPVSLVSRTLYSLYYLTSVGRTDDALDIADRARDEMPDVPGGITVLYAMICVFGRSFERGLREIDFALEGTPMFVQAHWVRGMAQEGLGDFAGAIETFERGVEMTKGSSLLLSQLGRACASYGDLDRARQVLSELDQRRENGGPAGYYTAEILAALGETEAALDRLYAAYRQRNPFMVFAGVMYGLDPLRGTRRFKDLLMRLGLPAYERSRREAKQPESPSW
ncbi:MAG: tetratricopeptide repeat protein [Gemmatimonadales bacterium]